MRIPRIYIDETLQAGTLLVLQGPSAHYIGSVLRKSAGDALRVFNGRGGEFNASIQSVQRHCVELQIREHLPIEHESPLRCQLGLAMSRGERMDWALQKTTELGVTHITPLATSRCELKLTGERITRKTAHWQQIAVSACEQCGRNRVPGIAPPAGLEAWIATVDTELALVCTADGAGIDTYAQRAPRSLSLLIGPEGGLTAEEVALATRSGFNTLKLGPRVLRTETAPVTAIALAQLLWGDL